MSLIAGLIELKIDGEIHNAKGNFTYNLGKDKREAVVGPDRIHGFKAQPQVPFIEGEISDRADLDVSSLLDIENATVTLSLANGKVIDLKDAWYAADGDIGTEEANIQVRFEGKKADEIS